jgi:hypothetical protein
MRIKTRSGVSLLEQKSGLEGSNLEEARESLSSAGKWLVERKAE